PLDRVMNARTPVYAPWFRITKGIYEYRCGRYQPALDWLQRGRDGVGHRSGQGLADLFASMALQRLGRTELARKVFLDAVRATPDDTFGIAARDPLDAGSAVHCWVVCQIALREAEVVLHA